MDGRKVALVALVALALAGCRDGAPGTPAAGGPAKPWHLGRPVIDSHVHLAPNLPALARALEIFERSGIGRFAVKSAGGVGTPRYQATLAMQRVLGDRLRVFGNLDWQSYGQPRWVEQQVRDLEQMKKDGLAGIKVFKNLGLSVHRPDGTLLPVDDPSLDPIFEACARLDLIFAWHVADPVAFFKAVTPDNERYEELQIAQGWSFFGPEYPTFQALMEAQERRIARHPKTTFLLIHMGNNAEDLGYVDRILSTYPNAWTDTSARVPEFGRHPADKVREFFVKHQDRILFGSDIVVDGAGQLQLGSVSPTEPGVDDAVVFYERHWRYFETDGKQIDHPTPIQGRWKVDAISLPAEVLHKLYVGNAERLIWQAHPLPAAARPVDAPAAP